MCANKLVCNIFLVTIYCSSPLETKCEHVIQSVTVNKLS